jgi:hypothetical protein
MGRVVPPAAPAGDWLQAKSASLSPVARRDRLIFLLDPSTFSLLNQLRFFLCLPQTIRCGNLIIFELRELSPLIQNTLYYDDLFNYTPNLRCHFPAGERDM